MLKRTKLKGILSVILTLGMLMGLLNLPVYAEGANSLKADQVWQLGTTAYTNAMTKTTFKRSTSGVYYVFSNIDAASFATNMSFSVYTDKNASSMSYYVSDSGFPTVTAGADAFETSNAAVEAFKAGAKATLTESENYILEDKVITWDLSGLQLEDGDTLLIYIPKWTGSGNATTGGGKHGTYPPTISFDYNTETSYLSITDENGTKVEDTTAVPVYSTYTIKMASTQELDTTRMSEIIILKDISDNVIPIEITTTSTQKGLLNFYESVIKTPVLAEGTEHKFEITKDLSDTTQVESISFTTASAPLLDEAVTDAAALEKDFVTITGVEPERVNQNFLVDTGIKNAQVFAAIVKKSDVVPVDEKITMSNQELAQKAIYSGTFTSDISTGKIEFTWVVDNTVESTDYVLLVERNFGLGDAYFEFYYKNPLQQDLVIAELNGTSITNPDCSREVFQTTLFNNAKLLGIDSTEYDALTSTTLADGGKSKVIDRLFARRAQIIDEASLNDLFNNAVAAQQVENTDIADDLKQLIISDVTKYGIDASPIYQTTYIATLPQYQISEALVFEEISKYDIDWVTDVKELFEVFTLKTALTNVGNYRLSYDILSSVNNVLGIDFAEYERRGNNKDQVLSIFVTSVTNAAKLSDIATIFNSAVSQVSIPVQTTTPSYGGGGGGGGGGGAAPSRGGSGGATAPSQDNTKLEATPAPQTNETSTFEDVEESHWASDYIKRLNKNGYISGYDDGSFRANNHITRGEFVTIITKAFALETGESTCHFMDVAEDNWAYPYIAAAYSRGIVNGINHDFFIPDKSISRQDAAVIIANLYKYLGIETEAGNTQFTDQADIADYAQNAMGYLADNGIINGYEDGSARPKANITRAETCKVISEAIDHRWAISNN